MILNHLLTIAGGYISSSKRLVDKRHVLQSKIKSRNLRYKIANKCMNASE